MGIVDGHISHITTVNRELVRDVHFLHPLTELEAGTANNSDFLLAGLGFQVEEVPKELKMGLDAKKSFAQMCEDVDVEDGVWGSSGVLETPNSKEARKEIRNRNRESAL